MKYKVNVKFLNLLKLILNTSDKNKEKVIGYDSKTFEKIKGKEIKLLIPIETLLEMEEDIKRLEAEDENIKIFIRVVICSTNNRGH